MVFSSVVFVLFFLPITLAGYYLINPRYRNYWLLIVSLVFFGWSQINYLWIIILNVAINYIASLLLDDCNRLKKPILFGAILANLGLLFYFKYFDFAIESINQLCGSTFSLKYIILPIGISFFTFQGMSYTIDVYRKQVPVQKNPLKVALYITLFPQLIAGPIVRYKEIANEIDERSINLNDFAIGIERFIIGLGKKAIIANTMAACVDRIWLTGVEYNTALISWVGSIAYTLQIYFDFSGYSDMAIGLGRMFGFHFNENFNLPYISKTISEFWRRWHISLSSWFRDYVYIPLGGNRKHIYFNLIIVFLLTGIWHGASWHFLIWGVWNGVFILAERLFIQHRKKKEERDIEVELPKWKKIATNTISIFYTLFVINIGWVLFRAPETGDAIKYIFTMFGLIKPIRVDFSVFWYLDKWTITIMIIGIFFSSAVPSRIKGIIERMISNNVILIAKYVFLIMLFFISMIRIVSGTYNPFIYFQF